MDKKDIAFLREMLAHHESALVMANKVIKTTKDAKIKAFAEKIVKTQSAEIDKMKSWLESAGESTSSSGSKSHGMTKFWDGIIA